MTVLEPHSPSPNTQATLLLCGRFDRQERSKPLTPLEYNKLVQWLVDRKMQPADLLVDGWPLGASQVGDGLTSKEVPALLRRGAALALATERWASKGLWVLGRSDEAYPRIFRERLGSDAPPLLFGAGPVELATCCGLAIVGSRDADDSSLAFAQQVASTCAQQGIQVVSGGARGIDSTAMVAALGAGGTVVGFLADSLAREAVSVRYRRALMENQLVLLSAMDPDSGFTIGNAMARNRYIYALATWGLVVTSALDAGGTWKGAVRELKTKRLPLFVRRPAPLPAAHRKLIDQGGLPFPDEPWEELATMLEAAAGAQRMTIAAIAPLQEQLPPEADLSMEPLSADLDPQSLDHPTLAPIDASTSEQREKISLSYAHILTVLPTLLAEPCTIEEIAVALETEKKHLRVWLKQAVAEGIVEKLQRPVRYRMAQQLMLPLQDVDETC